MARRRNRSASNRTRANAEEAPQSEMSSESEDDEQSFPEPTKKYVYMMRCSHGCVCVMRAGPSGAPCETNNLQAGISGLIGTVRNIYDDPETDKTRNQEYYMVEYETGHKVAAIIIPAIGPD